MYINGTAFEATLNIVPSIPHIVTGIRSKLKIWDMTTIKINCLIRWDSGFTLK
jgi:hypothetical protein